MRLLDDRPRVVVMCGVSGSGKTHYARRLEAAGYRRLSSDLIAWGLAGPALSAMSPECQSRVFDEASQLLLRQLEDLLASDTPVVVDATMCRRTKRDCVRSICDRHGIVPRFVYMRTPLDILRDRIARRHGDGPDDQIVPAERLERFYSGFERPYPDEEMTIIDP